MEKGYPGSISRPGSPNAQDLGVVSEVVEPGWGVIYDSGTNKYRLPTNAADRLNVTAVVMSDAGSPPSADGTKVEIPADSVVRLGVAGSYWLCAGEALETNDLVVFNQTNKNWGKLASPTTVAGTQKASMYAVSSAASGELVEVKLSGNISR